MSDGALLETAGAARQHPGADERARIEAAHAARHHGRQQLEQVAKAINAGDTEAIATADDILRDGAPGLAFFRFFAPAYNAWKGGGITFDAAKRDYQAEYGMSFSDYGADAKTMADLSQQLTSVSQQLTNAYNALLPTWQGDAAANFETKMAVFFKAAGTVTEDVANSGKDVATLVAGLQQLVLAKAQAVNELYAAELPNGIDGAMALSLVKVARGEADVRTAGAAFSVLGGRINPRTLLDEVFEPFGDLELKVQAAEMGQQLAKHWCNRVLVPQFEGREHSFTSVNSETQQRITAAFAQSTKALTSIEDPFDAMTAAGTAAAPTSPAGAGGAPSPGGGVPTSGVPTSGVPTAPTFVPVPPPVPSGAGDTSPGGSDIQRNHDGSVSVGTDRGLTISPEHGDNHVFRLTTTDPDGSTHIYRVHFDKHGDPVVSEVHPHGSTGAADFTAPAAQVPTGFGGGGGGVALAGAGSLGGGGTIPGGQLGTAHASTHAGSLQAGVEVGADNSVAAASAPDGSSQVAGSAAAAQQPDAHQGGGLGGMPLGMGMGRAGGGSQQESARRYPQHGDIVGEDDVEEWRRMGPVIGEE